jgi:5-methylcytosine-specific restriction endonuclease McrA
MSGRRRQGTGTPAVGTPAHRQRIGDRDSWRCGICTEPVDPALSVYESIWAAVVDHIIPRSRGGSHDDSNIQIAHYECNRLKGSHHPGSNYVRQMARRQYTINHATSRTPRRTSPRPEPQQQGNLVNNKVFPGRQLTLF